MGDWHKVKFTLKDKIWWLWNCKRLPPKVKVRALTKGQLEELGTDQTAKADKGKLQISLVPTQIIRDIAEIRMYGNAKYHSPDNWKQVEMVRYVDALCRHLLAFIDDYNSIDEESGKPHYKHMACNMAFICDMMAKNDK